MRSATILAALLFCATPAGAEMIAGRDLARIVIIDGDTISLPGGERVRIEDMDAPESYRAHCERELVAGLAAKERLAGLLRAGPVEIQRKGQDWFGRTLARVLVKGKSVGRILIEEGLALPYQRGKKARARRTAHWCGDAR